MSEQEYIDQIEALSDLSAPDVQHAKGDLLVSKALRELGWGKLADVYDEAKGSWWYA